MPLPLVFGVDIEQSQIGLTGNLKAEAQEPDLAQRHLEFVPHASDETTAIRPHPAGEREIERRNRLMYGVTSRYQAVYDLVF